MSGAPHRFSIIYRVPDDRRWVEVMRRHESAHPGLVRRVAFRSLDDPDEVMVDLEFESAPAATAFVSSLDLRSLLDEIGIESYPPVFIGSEIEELRIEYVDREL